MKIEELDIRHNKKGEFEVIVMETLEPIATLKRHPEDQERAWLLASAPTLALALMEVWNRIDLKNVPGGSVQLQKLVQDALVDAEVLVIDPKRWGFQAE